MKKITKYLLANAFPIYQQAVYTEQTLWTEMYCKQSFCDQ